MSAFIVNDFHINCLVSWASARHGVAQVSYVWPNQHVYWHGNEERIAQVLYAENVRSVNCRNQCRQPAEGFQFRLESRGMRMSAIQVIRAAHCLDY